MMLYSTDYFVHQKLPQGFLPSSSLSPRGRTGEGYSPTQFSLRSPRRSAPAPRGRSRVVCNCRLRSRQGSTDPGGGRLK